MAAEPAQSGIFGLIVAAGRGLRAGRDLPKQYVQLGGRTVLRRSIEALLSHRSIDRILVVIGPDDAPTYAEAVHGLPNLLAPVTGGATRQQSVLNGLEALAEHGPRIVLIHDAARPFAPADLVQRVIQACTDEMGAIPALPVTETLKRVKAGVIAATVPRQDLVTAQTPQGFPFRPLLDAHRQAAAAGHGDLTDDAAVAALAGLAVRVVAGDRRNLKLTTPSDFTAAE